MGISRLTFTAVAAVVATTAVGTTAGLYRAFCNTVKHGMADERVALQVVRAGGDPFGEALLVDRQVGRVLRRLRRVELLSHARAELDAEVDRLLAEAKRRRLFEANRSLQRRRDRLAADLDDLRR